VRVRAGAGLPVGVPGDSRVPPQQPRELSASDRAHACPRQRHPGAIAYFESTREPWNAEDGRDVGEPRGTQALLSAAPLLDPSRRPRIRLAAEPQSSIDPAPSV